LARTGIVHGFIVHSDGIHLVLRRTVETPSELASKDEHAPIHLQNAKYSKFTCDLDDTHIASVGIYNCHEVKLVCYGHFHHQQADLKQN
jgi:UDP-2,3-diacylglucosamine pyrophosphatase LpxH